MKKIITAAISLLLLASLCLTAVSCKNTESDIPEGMQVASTDGAYFRLYVPTTWTVNTQGGVSSAYYSNNDKSNVSAIHYIPDGTVTLAAETGEGAPETDSVAGISNIDEYWAMCAAIYKNELNNFELSESKDTLLDGLAAKQYNYTVIFDGVKYKYLQIVTEKNDEFIVFTYTATEANYDLHTEEVAKIIAEFKIK